ncbi:prominin-like protein isoform X3 [Rhynchophorus ferrugineus]|uniref:prominin-like protein isoform X3 n=1 Tax=Rhynchophorus ferrugineus TaxID=354439 RepID=UPI003FCC2C81
MEDRERNRRPVRVFSFLVTCLFLAVAVGMSNGIGTFVSKINTITTNLDRAVDDLNTNVSYTDCPADADYSSKTTFNSKGMGGLYNMTKMFIDVIVKGDILMPGLVKVENHNIDFKTPDFKEVLNYYKGLFALVLFLIVCIVVFPLAFLFFCCCRCCGNCGARSQPADKKKDLCKKICQGTLLIILGTGLLFCVVCAFVSNQQLYDGTNDLPSSVSNTIDDANRFLNSTNGQIACLLKTNYNEFSDTLIQTLNNSSDIVSNELENYSNATAMLSLLNFARSLGGVSDTLNTLKTDTNRLRVYGSQLNDALRKVKKDLLGTLNKCVLLQCQNVYNNINTLQTNIDFNKLPDLSDTISSFDKLNVSNIQQAAEEGNSKLNDLKNQINDTLLKGTNAASDQIRNSGDDIDTKMNEIKKSINSIQNEINDGTKPHIKTLEKYINEYSVYQHYIGIGISSVLLLVTLCIALGLICGICGKRPDGYSDNCCNKGTGSQFLICAVTIMFIFGVILAVIALVGAFTGIFADKLICTTFRSTEQSNTMDILDKLVDLGNDINVKPSYLLDKCHQNESIYITFNLESKFNISSIKEQFNISSHLDEFNIDDDMFKDFQILTTQNKETINQLKTVDIPDLDKFNQELQINFTSYNLTALSQELQALVKIIEGNPEENDQPLIQDINLSIMHLNIYDEKIVTPLKVLANAVIDDASTLNDLLKMNHSSFQEAVNDTLNEIDQAEQFLKTNGTNHLKSIIDAFKVTILDIVNDYMDRVEEHITKKIGLCGPLSDAFNSTLVATCDKILLPWNGFWFSLFWTTILYIITIIVAVKLANLYQKYKPYGHGYVETRGGKRDKKKGKKPKRYEERPTNVGHGAVSRGSHPVDGRYDDMAPKHWEDFPNGGPPHYQRAPTEYERPPPYYYPGTGGDQ